MIEEAKPRIKRLIWDIETSPNIGFFWRAGYRLNILHDCILHERSIICICYKWENSRNVFSLEWNKGDDRVLLQRFLEVALEADELVAHNGDKFDIKWFNTRCLKHGLQPPPIWKTVDTLAIARSRFYFNSNRLDYLGKFLLNEGKIKTDFELWHDIVINNCSKAMAKMVRYCKKDVTLLERVWHLLQPYHRPKTHVGVLNGLDKWTCPFTGSEDVKKSKTSITAAGTVQHQMISRAEGRSRYYTISDKSFRDYCEWKIEQKKKK